MSTPPPIFYIRRMYTALAEQLGNTCTFNQIAALFYEHGILDMPERPWPGVEGSKYDYALMKLSAADQSTVLQAIPGIIYSSLNDFDENPMDLGTVEWALKRLGFPKELQDEPNAPWDIYEYVPPPDTASQPGSGVQPLAIRIDGTGLPAPLAELIDELNDNLVRNNFNASALLIRRILTLASHIAMSRIGKEDELQTPNGDLELSAVIGRCQQNFRIAPQVISRVTSAKWVGDSANHSYKVRITSSDVETSVTACRLYLSELNLYSRDR